MPNRRNLSLETTILRGDSEITLTVAFDWTPGYKGCWYKRNGDPGDPPEPGEAEITSVTDGDGNEVQLTPDEEDAVLDKCYQKGESEV